MKVRNKAVLVLLGLYLVHAALERFDALVGDLIAGGLLFVIGFAMWLAKGMGAGDAKLMLPIGLFAGYLSLPIFAILLLLNSVILFILINLAARVGGNGRFWQRLKRMKREGKVPYALPLVVAAVPSMILGLYGPS